MKMKRRPGLGVWPILALLVVLLVWNVERVRGASSPTHANGKAEGEAAKHPIMLIPGFASSRLVSWKFKKCDSGLNIHTGDRVWLDVAHVVNDFIRDNCWLDCMKLNAIDQSDPETGCKLRAVSSIEAISELDPGQITGPLSSIFRDIIDALAENFGYDPSNLAAAPYDWRLPPEVLESRDSYFTNLELSLEELVQNNGGKASIVIAHSMGNNVFLYFIEWIKVRHPNDWQIWIDQHILAYFAVAAPLLGAVETLRGALTGITFGLPIAEASIREMSVTFGSQAWLLPRVDSRPGAGWPVDPLVVDMRHLPGRVHRSFSIEEVINGTAFSVLASHDRQCANMNFVHQKFYNQSFINPISAPDRPPIKHVISVYGINERTPVGYHFRTTDTGFRLRREIWEERNGEMYSATPLLGRKEYLRQSIYRKGGDGTVPYTSLSWSHTWHLGPVEITEVATRLDGTSRIGGFLDMIGMRGLIYGENVFQSSGSTHDGKDLFTKVVEFQHINHRDIIRHQKLRALIVSELINITNWQPNPSSPRTSPPSPDLSPSSSSSSHSSPSSPSPFISDHEEKLRKVKDAIEKKEKELRVLKAIEESLVVQLASSPSSSSSDQDQDPFSSS